MNSSARSQHFRRLSGWLLLMVFTMMQFQVIPALILAAAAADGGHVVQASAGRGCVSIVLHHVSVNQNMPPAQPHKGLLKWLASGGEQPGHPDHCFQFSSPELCADGKSGELPQSADLAERNVRLLAGYALPASPGRSVLPGIIHFWWPPAPFDDAWGHTVLLI
jgi:hypothetical protein